jgi:alkylation response protein AidB-like acyl-CoA dehydrogenase
METTMINTATNIRTRQTDWHGLAAKIGERLAARAAEHDADGTFVADNYALLREHRLFSAGIPAELGGGDATHSDICAIVRTLGKSCGSTALSFAMHSHPVAANVFKYRRGDQQARAALRKLAASELVIAGTGANDWLASNGEAIEVEGGFRVNAHKRFVSGGPGADVFVTSAVFDGDDGPEVLHFAIPMASEGIEIQSNWNTLGMRGTGSNDILMTDVFVPEAAVAARRPVGTWHPMWDVIVPIALPIIVSCYVGLAESAADMAVNSATGKPWQATTIGEMKTELAVAQMALAEMISTVDNYDFTPDLSITDAIVTRKAIAARSVKNVVEIASEVVGGGGFYRGHPMERIVRDVRAFHFHPLPERIQQSFSGRLALGLPPIEERA